MSASRRLFAALAAALPCALPLLPLKADEPAPPDARAARQPPTVALPGPRWRQSLLRYDAEFSDTARWLRAAEKVLRDHGNAVPVPFVPVTLVASMRGDDPDKPRQVTLVLYRSHWGTHAADFRTGKLQWEAPSRWSLDFMSVSPRGGPGAKQFAILNWMPLYLQPNQPTSRARALAVLNNTTVGTLSNDDKFAYSIEDLEVTPPIMRGPGLRDDEEDSPFLDAGLNGVMRHSWLQAYELSTGKLKWEAGDSSLKDGLDRYLFLGPPLPTGGQLYTLAIRRWKRSEVRDNLVPWLPVSDGVPYWETELLGLDRGNPVRHSPMIVSRHTLLLRAEEAPGSGRRVRAAHLVRAGDTLLCLTDAGVLAGFDLRAGKPAWSYSYHEKADDRPGPPDTPWHETAPWWNASSVSVAGGKVVFNAADSRSVHCLNLRDHTPAWKAPRTEDDVYVAGVFGSTVVVVGKKTARGLRLDNGVKTWEIPTGMPSGRGADRDGIYYLPLQKDAAARKPARILAFNATTGAVAATYTLPAKDAIGTLLFVDDQFVSQTNWEIAAYRLPGDKPGR